MVAVAAGADAQLTRPEASAGEAFYLPPSWLGLDRGDASS